MVETHYAVLQIGRDADATAIKRAYFRLVREFPPETKPDEFRQLREAYETLSDSDRRREYDAATGFRDHTDQAASVLMAAQHALDGRDWARAESLLATLLEARPDLHVALAMLAQALLGLSKPNGALLQLERATAMRPDIAAYHLLISTTRPDRLASLPTVRALVTVRALATASPTTSRHPAQRRRAGCAPSTSRLPARA